MTYDMNDFFLSYDNGNQSWCRDEFWGSTKLEMRDIMLEAATKFKNNPEDFQFFIKVIFLP